MSLTFKPFAPADFHEYRSWYDDPDLNRALGPPMDREWLDGVTSETDGCEYAVFHGHEFVAVVGIKFPDFEHSTYAITDIAVKPQLRGNGIGAQVLAELLKLHPLRPGESWVAHVHERNPRAKTFLAKQGWLCQSDSPDGHGMIEMSFTDTPEPLK